MTNLSLPSFTQRQLIRFAKIGERLKHYYETSPKFWHLLAWLAGCCLFLSMMQSVISHYVVDQFIQGGLLVTPHVQQGADSTENVSLNPLSDAITKRNLFNQSGAIPYADTPEAAQQALDAQFMASPCSPPKDLGVTLTGIIFSFDPKNRLVILKSPQADIADIYRIGDVLIDTPSVRVFNIPNPYTVELRKNEDKLCLTLPDIVGPKQILPQNQNMANQIILSRLKIQALLGKGYAVALENSSVIPATANGALLGFRVVYIGAGSLFSQIGLSVGDIITQVNGKQLQGSTQGFQIYEAFAHDSEVVLGVMHGNETVTKKVIIQ